MKNNQVGFVCFGEINTPFERLQLKHDEALAALSEKVEGLIDAGVVIDDPGYQYADAALAKLAGKDFYCLVVAVAGWVPTHAVIKVLDHYRHLPMVLWGLAGWYENGRLITTADQAGTTAIRPAMEAMHYTFKYVYSIVNKPLPVEKVASYVTAARAKAHLRDARIGSMGYRDMLLYGTQFEGNSMRGQIGVEVEPFEMLEMKQLIETLDPKDVADGVTFVKTNWVFKKDCDDSVIENGVKYALAIVKKIKERGWEAITLIDVDGMKKLEGFPPAMVFMLLEHYTNILTIPENDVLGAVTQLIMKYLTGQTVPYLEYYEFFEKSMLIGVPDFVPKAATAGDVTVLPAAFGLLNSSLLNVSKVKTGYVTCARLFYKDGRYFMHVYTGTAKEPPAWNEFGWDDPAPQLPSLEVFPDSCSVEAFAERVSCQHVIVAYGNFVEELRSFCKMMNIQMIY
ncbi:MAG: hypothetical protein IKY02_01495 [Lachnospiraceae bacterium]|nr:hypothetical protein [Lachnospiraceae bacterium]MBR5738644.1 hypothetical protein [Lachnospiraceae bacterium]